YGRIRLNVFLGVAGAPESIVDLGGLELRQQAANPFRVFAGDVAANPAQAHADDEILDRKYSEQPNDGRMRRRTEIDFVFMNTSNELRVFVQAQVAFAPSRTQPIPDAAERGAQIAHQKHLLAG